jgi:rhodanese-related sulfurtransferase
MNNSMKYNYLKILPFLFIFVCIQPAISQNTYKKLSVAQCDSLIKANETNPNFVILDVRTKSSWQSQHLEGSIYRNYYDSNFDAQLNALPKHKTFLVHCQSGGRSGQAFKKMQNLGFSEVYDMQGGMSAWKSGGYSTTSVIVPKLMLVNYEEISSEENDSGTDTIKITITNRANGQLSFTSSSLSDIHDISTNFNEDTELKGAEDYTFFIYHYPGYIETDTTGINIDSNGGTLDLNIIIKNGTIQSADELQLPELVLYPNPASHFINIKTIDGKPADKIILMNLNGQVLLTIQNKKSLDVSGMQSGVYFIGIEYEDKFQTKKLIITH